MVRAVTESPLSLVEFPADDPERARRFWSQLLGVEIEARRDGRRGLADALGGERGRRPRAWPRSRRHRLPAHFTVADIAVALERVEALGGSVIHPGQTWAICRDSEGSPFGLARAVAP